MEKVKLTNSQAEAIENTVSRYGEDLTVIRHAERYFNEGDWRILNVLTTAEVAKALYIGYEIEETFKVGDWVFDRESVYKIISKHHADDLNKGMYSKARHATLEEIAEEKQRRWWAKHGRECKEIRNGDIIYSYSTGITFVKDKNNRHITNFDGFRVVCFAEDRKDVQG